MSEKIEKKTATYETSNAEGHVDFINAYDLEEAAKKVMPKGGYDYVAGGAGDLWTLEENIRAFNHKLIVPEALQEIESADQSTSIFGEEISTPIIMAPTASHGLANKRAEPATAKGVAESNTIMTVSSFANKPLSEIVAAANGAPHWFQFYMSPDEGITRQILEDAVENGAKAIVLTADAIIGGNREADRRNAFTFPLSMPIVQAYQSGVGQSTTSVADPFKRNLGPKDVELIASITNLPVIVKGIQSAKSARIAIESGAEAVWVTNHGGRQLDGGPASFDSLPYVAEEVNKQVPIIFDGGIRRGQHVFKAIAEGADLVAIGRPAIYGLALGGSQGVKEVFDYFKKELDMVMQLSGTSTVEEIKQTQLRNNVYGK